MNARKRMKLVEDISNLLIAHGYELTKYGTYQKLNKKTGNMIRYKFTKIGLRKEVQSVFSDGTKSWSRLSSGYLKDLYITEDRKIGGLTK